MQKITENAMTVLTSRSYLKKDSKGKVLETPEKMFGRVAKAVAEAGAAYGEDIEKQAEAFEEMMANMEFLPNSPTLMNAGKNGRSQLSACFVLPVSDSLESIFKTLHDAALVLRTGGGVGFSFSRLRPRDDRVKATGGVSSGPVPFMELFDHMAKTINEGSKRRVAMMGILRVDHPDIEEFIVEKLDGKKLKNFNVSVGITDEFMEALAKSKKYPLRNPQNNKIVRWESAGRIMQLICEHAWRVADPGLVFLDQMNKACPVRHLGEIEATNPCGEQPLLPYQSCNLGSINLAQFVRGKRVNWKRLEKVLRLGVRFLDDVIDVSAFPLPEIKEMAQKTRKIGLGVMGWADMLYQMEIAYNSDKAVSLAEKLSKFIQKTARDESVKLGGTRGSFPAFRGSKWQKKGFEAMRNSTVNTVAPTGTISIIANCSSGVEPLFALVFARKNILKLGETELVETNKWFGKALKKVIRSESKRKKILKSVAAGEELGKIDEVSKELKEVFVTSHDVGVSWHIKMQAAWQRYTDSAVSKTINMPNAATVEDVKEAYLMAYKLKCKGVTVYRDQSREQQVLNLPVDKKVIEVRGNGEAKISDSKHEHEEVIFDGESGICPDCGTTMVMGDGCATCPACAYSYCSA